MHFEIEDAFLNFSGRGLKTDDLGYYCYLLMTFYRPLMKVFEEDRVSESQLIQDIKFTRHRLELMFRVAHMNRDKTKLLVKTMDPGDPSEGTVSRPPRYNPQQILEIPMVSESKSDVNFERATTNNGTLHTWTAPAVREAVKTELSFLRS